MVDPKSRPRPDSPGRSVEACRAETNIARFDLVSIRLAVICADSGSLSAAVKVAHCSISAGSERISALEEVLGAPLFIRDHRGLRPTPVGEVFVRHARLLLGQLEVLKQEVAGSLELSTTLDG